MQTFSFVVVECDEGRFDTIKDFAEHYGLHVSTPIKWHSGKKKIPQKWLNLNIKFVD